MILSRRNFIAMLAAYATRSSAGARAQLFSGVGVFPGVGCSPPIFRPESFGAVADGKTDCYPAFQKMIEAVNRAGSARIEFSKGTYLVDRYRIRDGEGADGVEGFEFHSVTGLQLVGSGTRIEHKGDFHRSADQVRRGKDKRQLSFSYRGSVTWMFRRCSHVAVENIEFDGNVDRMTRDLDVIEDAWGNGLRFLSCANVAITDVNIHHWYADGLNFTRDRASSAVPPCTNVVCTRVSSLNNGRQGLTADALFSATFTDCRFSNNGRTDGAYGGHAPMAGVDVEPDGSVERGQVTQNTGNLDFVRCEMANNRGYILSAPYYERYSGRITLTDCKLDVGDQPIGKMQIKFILQAPHARVNGGSLNLRGGVANLTWRASNQTRSTYRSVEFSSARPSGAIISTQPATLELEACRFTLAANAPADGPIVRITNPLAVLRDNHFFIRSAAGTRRTDQPAIVLDVSVADGNRYETDSGTRAASPVLVQERARAGGRAASLVGHVRIIGVK